jgi:hypothetical protein
MNKRNLTALYNSYAEAQRAVEGLEDAGIPHSDISIVANDPAARHSNAGSDAAVGGAVGGVAGGAAGLLAGVGLLAIPGIGPVVAAGWLVATAVGAVVGASAGAATGGIVGALTQSGVREEHAHVYAESIRRGGTLVTARVDDDRAGAAEAILRAGSVDPVARGERYRGAGWSAFDPSAPPFVGADLERERELAGRDRIF